MNFHIRIISFFAQDAGTDWGNIGTLYLAIYVDLNTGEALEKPEVRIMNREGELPQTPVLRYQINEDGLPVYSWTPVQGAEKYFLVSMTQNTTGGFDGAAYVVAETTDTTWTETDIEYGMSSIVNADYKTYKVSENDWNNEYSIDYYKETYGEEKGTIISVDSYLKRFSVIAVSEKGTSMLSNGYTQKDLAANLPYRMALETAKKDGAFQYSYENFSQIPIYGYVTMCDGSTVKKLITYDVNAAKVTAERYANVDEDGKPISFETLDVLNIPYKIDGTPFEDILNVVDYDSSNQKIDLKELKERQDKLRTRAGNMEIVGTQDEKITLNGAHVEESVRKIDSSMEIDANSALSEYLALNMLGTTEIIDLTKFPESADKKYLTDSWKEAYYQNPYILGVSGYSMSYDGTLMKVSYDDEKTTAKKQKKIREKAKEITSNIIRKNMTELEKEMAINQFLCDTISYDEEALENAAKNNYKSVDSEYKDSFTAYGALINGRCVCAGYSAAFKLLAKEAGLDAIVVTGILEGGLSHAWNKVCIDGKWQIIDTTNNDNEYLNNALFNLSDRIGKKVLVPDKDYMLDQSIKKYEATEENKEYYRVEDKYYTEDTIAEYLAKDLMKNGHTTLRTEYDIDDNRFYNITDNVYELIGEEYELEGYYWMGVIYLSLVVQ